MVHRIGYERPESIDELLKAKHGQKMSGAEVATLTMIGLNRTQFGLPGGAILPLDQMLAQYSKLVQYVLVKHEAHAAHAGGAMGEILGVPGIAVVTSGPGAVNALTGLYDSTMEFYPLLLVTGNVPLSALKNPYIRAFQGARVVEAAKALGKDAFLVEDVHKVQRTLIEAFLLAMTHPYGGVLVDLPKLETQIMETTFEYFQQPIPNGMQSSLDQKVLREFAEELQKAERPFVVLGRGAFSARQEVWELIERMSLPFGYTLKGKGVLPDDHPQNYGSVGQHGKKATNIALRDADIVLMIGCNGDDRAFLNNEGFTKGKRALINPYTVNALARLTIDYVINVEAEYSTAELLKLVDGNGQHEKLRRWNVQIRENFDKEPVYNEVKSGISPVDLMRDIDSAFNPDVLVLDIGEHQMHAMNHIKLEFGYDRSQLYGTTPVQIRTKFNKRVFTSGTAGTMATLLPFASGAYIAIDNHNKQHLVEGQYKKPSVLGVIGDGGLEMHVAALWIPSANELDIPIVVMNNHSYGQVFEWLTNMHNLQVEHSYTSKERDGPHGKIVIPNFAGVGVMYNLPYWTVEDPKLLTQVLNAFKNGKGPRILDVIVPNMGAYPFIKTGEDVERAYERPLRRKNIL